MEKKFSRTGAQKSRHFLKPLSIRKAENLHSVKTSAINRSWGLATRLERRRVK